MASARVLITGGHVLDSRIKSGYDDEELTLHLRARLHRSR
jgi:hypothetical protein